jgi:hypothetical protein
MGRVVVALIGIGVVGALLLAPGNADAACIDILKEWQSKVPDRASSNAVDREVERANGALKRGNDRACREHMRNAHSMLRNPPSYRQPLDDRASRDPRYGEPSYRPGWGWGRPRYDGRDDARSWGRDYEGR